ncbi:hypothetical protein K1T71_008639 [Dendrolimus kikuchii]|uniref:Uncharacterized protein n=1 Tax=Dendrolimus kikuchii TaxID=765133 RepID=A0ACC1CVC0_9NEOP|nr:hypothetical protein K1T71_008639 [Dendrolimus kikuchii]
MLIPKCLLFMVFITITQCRVPDKVFCANEKCNEPISEARTLLNYNSGDPDLISFRGNAKSLVFMKSAGTNSDLWFVEIGDKTGFVNKQFLKETKILSRKPKFEFPLEDALRKESEVQPDKVQKAHEVIEGTTIYTTESIPLTEPTPVPPFLPMPSPDVLPHEEEKTSIKESSEIDDTIPQHNSNENNEDPASNNSEQEIEIVSNDNIPDENKEQEVNKEDKTNENIPEGDLTYPTIEKPETDESILKRFNIKTKDNNVEVQSEPLSSNSGELETEDVQPENEISNNQENNSELDVHNKSSNKGNESEIIEKYLPDENINHEKDNSEIKKAIITESDDIQKQVETNQSKISSEEELMKYVETTEEVTLQNHTEKVTDEINDKENINNLEQTLSQSELPKEETVKNLQNQIIDEPTDGDSLSDNNITDDIKYLDDDEMDDEEIDDGEIDDLNDNNVNYIENNNNDINNNKDINNNQNSETTWQASKNTLPPIFHEEPLTIPAKFDTESPLTSTLNPNYMENNQPEQDITNSVYITEEPKNDESYSSTENILNELSDNNNDVPISTTETPQTETAESLLSNMYSSIADIWPSTTEEPKSIFNHEDYPPYEKEKVDGEGSFSFISYLLSSISSVVGSRDQTKALFAATGGSCFTDDYCDGASTEHNNRLLTFLLTTASSVLLFTLGYYYLDNRRQDGRLIGTINSLQRDLLFTTKECEILKEELASTKTKLAGIEDSSFGMDDMVQSLKEEINELKAQNERLRNSLDDNEKLLRVSENTAGELQNTLGEVEHTLSELLGERAVAEEQIAELNGKLQAFEEELISVSRDRDNFQLKYVSAETALEEAKKLNKQLDEINKKLAEANNTISLQKHEINALKEAIKELKTGFNSNVDATSLIDHIEIKAKLSKALEEKNSLASQFEIEHNERKRLADELQITQETLHTSSQQATEAMTRLEVLGKYFQERESDLMKELSTKEALWLSKQGESASTVEKIELLQQEVQRYKEKCDALTLELAEQESNRRSAVGEVEARAHNAWLEARAAKREADAARDEAAALRRKLASLSTHPTADGAASPHHKVSSPLEGGENVLPPGALPPLAFLPPPLLPPLPRPPPLGRLPSPHPPRIGARDYSPDSRYSPGSRYSPVSRYSPETVRYSPDSRYSPRRRSPYSPRSRRRSRDRYDQGRGSRTRNGPPDTETEYNSDSPSREPRHRRRYSRHSGPSSGSGCSSESEK